ncbi:unnamed protein product [Brugia timori]|uniref:Uncharacterized protein n=1 Tax=Brugia timori TaxID=42155 RepID=A0A0R3QAN8_9BILA|nr:unnamed protein product [Brugia timori]
MNLHRISKAAVVQHSVRRYRCLPFCSCTNNHLPRIPHDH